MATALTIHDATRGQPLRLRLLDCTEYEVAHPDWISEPLAPRAREVLFFNDPTVG
jgi:hypothetical protein